MSYHSIAEIAERARNEAKKACDIQPGTRKLGEHRQDGIGAHKQLLERRVWITDHENRVGDRRNISRFASVASENCGYLWRVRRRKSQAIIAVAHEEPAH